MEAFVIFISFFVSIILGTLSVYYSKIPEKELKRSAKNGTENDKIILQIINNKPVSFTYLWIFTYGLLIVAIDLIFVNYDVKLAIILLLILPLLFFYLINKQYFAKRIAYKLSPIFLKLIIKTKPYIGWFANFLYKNISNKSAHKIYELEDLVELIEDQKTNKLNRIDKEKLDLAIRVLSFGDKIVDEVMTDKKSVRFLDSDALISTVLIDELHQTGSRHFPVYKDKKSNVVGVLDLDELVQKRMSGKVAWAISSEIEQVEAGSSLQKVLSLFLKTKQQIYLVVDKEMKIKGVVEISKVLKELIPN